MSDRPEFNALRAVDELRQIAANMAQSDDYIVASDARNLDDLADALEQEFGGTE